MAKKKMKFKAEFKSVSIGTNTVRIGFELDRPCLTLDEADDLFSNSQVRCNIVCDPNSKKDVEGQETFDETGTKVQVIADIKGYRVEEDCYKAALSLNKHESDVAVLGSFANAKATLEMERIGAAATETESEAA
jgi:hypothetical protein